MKCLILILSPLLAAASSCVAAPLQAKWHPGHYVYIGHDALTPEVLELPHFRGVQKIYSWREFEPTEGHYDFSTLRTDLALARKHGRQLVMQFTHKAFAKGSRSIPDYITGPKYGGGVYLTVKGSFNPVLWNRNVADRLDAVIRALGREFDRDPNLEAVNLPESAPNAYLDKSPQAGVETYTEEIYLEALKHIMTTLRHAFPNTVVIQYTNFPPKLLDRLTDYEKEIGVGMGGPDVYPGVSPSLKDPQKGVYRLYAKLAGTVPMGAAVQSTNYREADKKRWHLNRGDTTLDGKPIVITAQDEKLFPVSAHLKLAHDTLKLNYLFWATDPRDGFEAVKKFLAGPAVAGDPAGGLHAELPPKAFLH
ncbi:MAG: hypothetical protein KBA71_05955 [Opitutaceae bacterium]|nr:hypothetical protein [Opitutaceae bacterium]